MVAAASPSYALKRYETSKDPDLAEALLVYIRNTAADIRTDPEEITYWIDHFAEKFGDEFYVFGFYCDGMVIGYAEAAYFVAERLIALDYIVVNEPDREPDVFLTFMRYLKNYLESAHQNYRYGVAEVTYGPGRQIRSRDTIKMTRLLQARGFHIIHGPYHQPALGDNRESEMQADLLMFSTSEMDSIKPETYLSIVHTLYYKYYLRWYTYGPVSKNYKKPLDQLFRRIKKAVRERDRIFIGDREDELSKPAPPISEDRRILVFVARAIGIIVLLTIALVALQWAFKIPNSSFIAIYIVAVSSVIAVAGIVSKEARKIFKQIVSLAKVYIHAKGIDSGRSQKSPGDSSSGELDDSSK
jgi:hypothetical protein